MTLSKSGVLRNFTARDFHASGGADTGPAPVPGSPKVTGIMPNTAEVGGPYLLVTVSGGGFTAESVIVWDGGDVVTTFVSKSALTTVTNPSTATSPAAVPVTVRTGELTAPTPVEFTFINPVVPEGTSEEILNWVNNSADRATMALEAEEADEEPRSELVSRLEAIINTEPKPKPKPRPKATSTA